MQPNQLKTAHFFVSRIIYVLDDEIQSVNFCMIMLLAFLFLSLPSRKKKGYVDLGIALQKVLLCDSSKRFGN